MQEKGVHVRYVGDGVRSVPGFGNFQHGTVAFVPRDLAFELLREDCFVVEPAGKPVIQLIVRAGQYQDPKAGPPPGKLPPLPEPPDAAAAEEGPPPTPPAAGP